jgi:peptidoglycan/xylan/chitin deacetylase (PgdA/CDA1 family)/subtilisin-like proprotein convertase family protein
MLSIRAARFPEAVIAGDWFPGWRRSPSAQRRVARRPAFETLESRTLLAANSTLSSAALVSGPLETAPVATVTAAPASISAQAAAVSTASFSRTFTTRVNIPDGPTGTSVGWDIDARSLPADAYVTSIKVRHKVTHPRIGDLQATLYNDAGTTWTIRNNVGGTKKNFDETKTDATVFAGSAARQIWHYRIRDTVRLQTGTLDRLEVTLTYEVIPLHIVDTSLSAATARDGQTLTLGYKIASTADTTVTLGTTLIPRSGKWFEDHFHNVQAHVTPGTNWYYRTLPLNLPPQPELGVYDVQWELIGGPGGYDAVTRNAALSVQSPVSVRVPILMYHHINDGPQVDGVAPAMLRAEIEALQAYGYTPVTLQELMDFRAGAATPPAKPVLLTFDDGYADLYTAAFPILSDPTIRAKATAFIFTAGVETDPAIVTWPQLRAMDTSGLVEVESHTVSHRHLTQLTTSQLTAELVNSKAALESHLGKETRYLCYPYGDYNATVLQAAWSAGYAGGTAAWGGVEPTSANKFALSRVAIVRATSVDYDPAHPENFFFTKIADPSVVVPLLTFNSVQYLNPTTGQPVTQLTPGQTVRVQATVTNAGPSAPVVATLQLDADNNPANGVAYNSHTVSPSQDIRRTFAAGTQTFEWTWQVPAGATTGQYYAQVKFRDDRYVLGFRDSGWQAAFAVSAAATSPLATGSPSVTVAPPGGGQILSSTARTTRAESATPPAATASQTSQPTQLRGSVTKQDSSLSASAVDLLLSGPSVGDILAAR